MESKSTEQSAKSVAKQQIRGGIQSNEYLTKVYTATRKRVEIGGADGAGLLVNYVVAMEEMSGLCLESLEKNVELKDIDSKSNSGLKADLDYIIRNSYGIGGGAVRVISSALVGLDHKEMERIAKLQIKAVYRSLIDHDMDTEKRFDTRRKAMVLAFARLVDPSCKAEAQAVQDKFEECLGQVKGEEDNFDALFSDNTKEGLHKGEYRDFSGMNLEKLAPAILEKIKEAIEEIKAIKERELPDPATEDATEEEVNKANAAIEDAKKKKKDEEAECNKNIQKWCEFSNLLFKMAKDQAEFELSIIERHYQQQRKSSDPQVVALADAVLKQCALERSKQKFNEKLAKFGGRGKELSTQIIRGVSNALFAVGVDFTTAVAVAGGVGVAAIAGGAASGMVGIELQALTSAVMERSATGVLAALSNVNPMFASLVGLLIVGGFAGSMALMVGVVHKNVRDHGIELIGTDDFKSVFNETLAGVSKHYSTNELAKH